MDQRPTHEDAEWVELHFLDFPDEASRKGTIRGWFMWQVTCCARFAEVRADFSIDKALEIAANVAQLFGNTNISVRAYGTADSTTEVAVVSSKEPTVRHLPANRAADAPYSGVDVYVVTISGYMAVR